MALRPPWPNRETTSIKPDSCFRFASNDRVISRRQQVSATLLAVLFGLGRQAAEPVFGWLLLGGSALYLVTAGAISAVEEDASEEAGGDLLGDLRDRLRSVYADPTLRRFVIARTLYFCRRAFNFSNAARALARPSEWAMTGSG